MNPLTLLLLFTTIKYLHQILYGVYLLQLKEYRHDRLKEHIERKHKTLLRGWFHIGIGAPLSHRMLPRPTAKSTALVMMGILIGWISVRMFGVLGGAIILLFSPMIILLSLWIFLPIELAIRHVMYKRAQSKIAVLKSRGLRVVGITGSYGKTTTKNFLKEILSTKFSVLASDKSINTPLGIAQTILKQLKESHEIFIVEMGAYKKGEITELCDIAMPDFAIVTGISNQHIELFGSQKNIIEAKSELPNSLKPHSITFINSSSEFHPKLLQSTLKTVRVVEYNPEKPPENYVKNVKDLSIPDFLKGNLVPCILFAHELGISENLIKKGMDGVVEVDKTMKPQSGYAGAEVIDDSRNSSETGTLAALEFLSHHKRTNRLVVMPCLIELGEKTHAVHTHIGETLNKYAFDVVLTTDDYYDSVKAGYGDPNKLRLITDPQKTISYLRQILDKEWVVLIEGKVNEEIVNFLCKH